MRSFVAIVMDGDREAANAVLEAAGFGPNNFVVPMSPDGKQPPTHWAFRHQGDDMIAALPATVTVHISNSLNNHMAIAAAAHGVMLMVTPEY